MARRELSASKLVKYFFVAILGCAIGFAVLIAAGVLWVRSLKGGPAKPRPTMVMARNDFPPPFEVPRTFKKNAILGDVLERAAPGDDIFIDLVIPKIEITVEGAEWSKLKRSPREYVLATITEGEKKYTNVAFRLKGGPGSYRDVGDMPSFTVNFDKFAEGQTFHGLKKIHLNSSVQDRSLMEEKISRELFNAAGVPTPRAGNAQVTFNDRLLGVYVLVEGINKQFLKRHYKDPDGNVYDGKSGNEVDQNMRTNSGDDRKDKSGLRALAVAAKEPDLTLRRAALEDTLDVDRFLSYMAMEMILWHWDGYTMHRNNFRLFHDRPNDRMVFFPQGMDQMLNGDSTGRSVIPQQAGGLVARSVLEVPEFRQRYRERVAQIATNVFRADAIASRIYEVSTAVRGALAEVDERAASSHGAMADSLRRRVRARAAYLERFISPPKPITFNEQGLAALSTWRPQTDLGQPTFSQERDGEGKTLLRIATKEFCTASYRTVVRLDPGSYQFEARIKTKGVVFKEIDEKAGAGLRISRFRKGQRHAGDNDWMPTTFEFEVTPEKPEVELVCELRANAGEIFFDLASLKLKKL